ncbi:hypothetical protein Trydic_g8002 [Trypoxylus dichotomus]
MFSFQDITALEFEELAEPDEAQFVEETAEEEEDKYEEIACVPEKGESVIDLDYKTRAVDYWKSGKSKPRTLAGVIQKLKKVCLCLECGNVETVVGFRVYGNCKLPSPLSCAVTSHKPEGAGKSPKKNLRGRLVPSPNASTKPIFEYQGNY